MRAKSDVLVLCGGLALCGVACTAAPSAGAITVLGVLASVTAGFAKDLIPNITADLFSRFADRVKDRLENSDKAAHNHDLRELVILAIENVILESMQGTDLAREGYRRLRYFSDGIRGRVERAAADPRFIDIWEKNIVPEFFLSEKGDLSEVKALTPELWKSFLNEIDYADLSEQERLALDLAANALHSDFPRYLADSYRKSLARHPHLYVALQTAILQEIWRAVEETRLTSKSITQTQSNLSKQLKELCTTIRKWNPERFEEAITELRVLGYTVEWLLRETHSHVYTIRKQVHDLHRHFIHPATSQLHVSVTDRTAVRSKWAFDLQVLADRGHCLRNSITKEYLLQSRCKGDRPSPFHVTVWQQWLESVYQIEAREMLHRTKALRLAGLQQVRAYAEHHPLYVGRAGDHPIISGSSLQIASGSDRYGIGSGISVVNGLTSNSRPLRFALSPAHLGSAMLLYYLKFARQQPIEIVFSAAHSVELARRAVDNSFSTPIDCLTLTLGTAAFLLQHGNLASFTPHMILPPMSHGVVGPVKSMEGDLHCYAFMDDPPASEAFIFHDMAQSGKLQTDRAAHAHIEPDETTALLAEGQKDLRAIIGFPHYHLQRQFNQCQVLNEPLSDESCRDIVLFVRKDLLDNPQIARSISISLRDAWLSLCEQAALRDSLVRLLLLDRDYLRLVARCAGMHYLQLEEC